MEQQGEPQQRGERAAHQSAICAACRPTSQESEIGLSY
jgi:hypothetical protein